MRFRRRRFPSRRGNNPGRAKEWVTFWSSTPSGGECVIPTAYAPTGFVNSWMLDPDEAIQNFDEPTIVRMLISNYVAAGTENPGVAQWFRYSAGIIVWKGVDEPPNPVDPLVFGDFDFLWRHDYIATVVLPGTAQITAIGGEMVTEFDIRSKRKLERGEGLLFCSYMDECSNITGLLYHSFTARALFLNR